MSTNLLKFQRDCIELDSPQAPFVLFNGVGVAECQWINARLGIAKFKETGGAFCALNVPDVIEVFATYEQAIEVMQHRATA